MPKILYLSCHAVLEYDEVKLLTELGYEVCSHGCYRDPRGAYTLPRPGIEGMKFDKSFFDLTGLYPKTNLPPELIDPFDIIIIMSGENEAPLIQNWNKIKHKRVILRTIGQSIGNTEYSIQKMRKEGLQIVRYSPKEKNVSNYAGEDEIIRFYKDPNEFQGWTGENPVPVNFSQSLRGRSIFVHYEQVMGALSGFKGALVYGSGNDDLGKFNGGEIPFDRQLDIYRQSGAYLYAGTWPASYTLSFVEAMMTGIPIVAASKKIAHINSLEQFDFYEVDEIIEHKVNGFVCDSIEDMRFWLKWLIDNKAEAKKIGERGRAKAIELFGKTTIARQWKEFIDEGVKINVS